MRTVSLSDGSDSFEVARVAIDLHIVEDADHFSFMNARPP
jgi:hypothetical protein